MSIELVELQPRFPTSYFNGGQTRLAGGGIPHLSMVKKIGDIAGPAWRLAKRAASDWHALLLAMEAEGVEVARLTEAWRDPERQARAREQYVGWVNAGRPQPGGAGWATGMKTAYVAKAGESNHGWGGSVDIDVGALQMPGAQRGSNAALAAFWDLAAEHGWFPIIGKPSVNQSESWHFDHLGPLAAVRALFDEAGNSYRGSAYGQTARVGCALAHTLPRSIVGDVNVAHVQARCAIAGHFPGAIDGVMGPKTRAALKAAGISATNRTKPTALISKLDEAEIGFEEMATA